MKLRGCRRMRLAFWSLVCISAVMVLVWILSGRYIINRMGARSRFVASNGAVWFGWNPRRKENAAPWHGWSIGLLPAEERWIFEVWLPQRGFNEIGGWRHVQ